MPVSARASAIVWVHDILALATLNFHGSRYCPYKIPPSTLRRPPPLSTFSTDRHIPQSNLPPIDCNMADVATSPVAQTVTADAPATQGKQPIVKPDKPDDDKYKEDLAKVEKEHTAAQEKLVRLSHIYDCFSKLRNIVAHWCT